MPKGIKGFQKGHKVNLGKKHTKEWKKRMSLLRKGKPGHKHSKKTKQKIGNARKGKKRKSFSKKWRKNISKYHADFSGKNHPRWKGGKIKNTQGYILIKVFSHPYGNNQKYVKHSRLVMERHLGRFLKPKEVVHHRNGIRDDDRIENLKLFKNNSEHRRFHRFINHTSPKTSLPL